MENKNYVKKDKIGNGKVKRVLGSTMSKNGKKDFESGYKKDFKKDGRNDSQKDHRNDVNKETRKDWKEAQGKDKGDSFAKKSYKADVDKSGKKVYVKTDLKSKYKTAGRADKYLDKKTKVPGDKKEIRGESKEWRRDSKDGHKRGASDISKNISGMEVCPVYKKCGGCQLQGIPYKEQLKTKEKQVRKLLEKFCKVHPIIGMENPYHYRNKVHAVFDRDKRGNYICGVYQAGTHIVVPIESCLIEDKKADEIIQSIKGLLKSFKIRTYDEDTGYGLLRHVLVKRGFATGEIMVVMVTASPVFPSKNNFVEALRKIHPEITTIIQNVNGRGTSMVLGNNEKTMYGKGYIEDVLCGCKFRISSKSFYQINPVQTEVMYKIAIDAAGLTGKETVIDAYCGIGTIGLIASNKAEQVIGVELNKDAVRDAITNAKLNEIENTRFYCADAGKFMVEMAEAGSTADVVFMDPPRSGSTEEFIDSLVKMGPEKVVYVSCNPETLVRDLEYFKKKGYRGNEAWVVDMFAFTSHVEVVIQMSYCGDKRK